MSDELYDSQPPPVCSCDHVRDFHRSPTEREQPGNWCMGLDCDCNEWAPAEASR